MLTTAPPIPRHIHFIWIGSTIPTKYIDNLQQFHSLNKGNFKIVLWVDRPTTPIVGVEIRQRQQLPLLTQAIYDRETNWGAKADILRYEIIYRFGGMYNDIDTIWLKPLDPTVFGRAFVSHTFEPWNNLTCAVFGCPPRHHLLEVVLNRLPTVSPSLPVEHRTGPYLFTNCFVDLYGGNGVPWRELCQRQFDLQLIHQDLLVFPRRSTNSDRRVGYSYHLNDANWTTPAGRRPPTVALCTAIKNRLSHLQQTLPQNIADSGPGTEFVVVDYSSDDGLSTWIKPFVSNGLVTYIRIDNQKFWRNSHAKNVSVLAASAPIVCNVDADNFVMAGFTNYLSDFYAKHTKAILAAPPATEGVTGRISTRRDEFIALGGYNEMFSMGWGCEDIDLIARARGLGYSTHTIDSRYLKQIAHDNTLRGQHGEATDIAASNRHSLAIMATTLANHHYVANAGKVWGYCEAVKNYQAACIIKSAN